MKFITAILINLAFVPNLFAQEAATAKQSGGIVGLLLPMVVVFAIFYLLLIRPQQKQQKKVKAMLESIEKGDEVITRGGVHGSVVGISEDGVVTLEIAQNVKIKINREFIGVVKGKEPTKK